MNYLYISQSELLESQEVANKSEISACLTGLRAEEAIKDHDLKSGICISCVVEGSGRGKVTIGDCSKERVNLSVKIEEQLPPRLAVDLAVAYSRPQTLKKLFQLSASLGVRSLSFVKTENVVPSYLQSKSLEPLEIQRQLILGCEQAGDGVFPVINNYRSFYEFLNNPEIQNFKGHKLFGDIRSKPQTPATVAEAILFLGPESGFTEAEKEALKEAKFEVISLGPRVLRVEVASAMLLGSILPALY